ncbi:hypothetical protein [Caproicibacter sp.]|uniref:hypothetical protein n=1 Tax=Caproicibacter sp. TaxID=2814884 RepID=UPI0039896D06
MLKKSIVVFVLCGCFPLLSGCTQKMSPSAATTYLQPAASENAGASVLNNHRYLKMNIVTKDETMLYGKPVVSFSKSNSNKNLKKFTVDKISDAWVWNLSNRRSLLFCFSSENGPVIASYSLEGNQYTPLIRLKNGHAAEFKAINDHYLLWAESTSTDWTDTTLHIYDFRTQKDKIFYTDTVDPESGSIYAVNSNPCVIRDNTIYFDDIVGIDSDGNYKINLYAYKISDETISLVKEQAQKPFIYQSSVGWFEFDKNTGNPVMVLNKSQCPAKKYLIDNGTSMFHFCQDAISVTDLLTMPDTGKLFHSNKSSSSIYSDKEKKTVDGMGFTLLTETSATPLLVLKGLSLGPTAVNQKAVIWSRIENGFPMFYDIKSQNFVMMDNLPKGTYSCVMNDNDLLFINTKTAYLLTLS